MISDSEREFIRQHMCPYCYRPFTVRFNNSLGIQSMVIKVTCKHKKEIAKMIEECLK